MPLSAPSSPRALLIGFAAALAIACAPAKAPGAGPGEQRAADEQLASRTENEQDRGGAKQTGTKGGAPRGEAAPPVAGKEYDLVVKFRSAGQGTDRDARARLDAMFDAIPDLGRAHGRWGREGEVDECADLDRVPAAERAALVARVKESMKSGRNVDVLEHHACEHDFGVAQERFELVVVFFSPGDGTDAKAEAALDKIAASWPKVAHASYAWGKEGEHNECFSFGSAQDARDDFLRRIKTEGVAASNRVRIEHDARCSLR